MGFSPEGEKLLAEFQHDLEALKAAADALAPKVGKREAKAKTRMQEALKSKDGGSHLLKGIKTKFIETLKPRNAATTAALAEVKAQVQNAKKTSESQEKYLEDQVLKLLESQPQGNPGYEKSTLGVMNKTINGVSVKLAAAESAYQAAKVKEKEVFKLMLGYLEAKPDAKKEGKEFYDAFKKSFTAALAEPTAKD